MNQNNNLIQQTYKFIIPQNPDSINEVMSFGERKGKQKQNKYSGIWDLKRKWEQITIDELKINNHDFPQIFQGHIGFRFEMTFEQKKRRDCDNYFLMCKGIIDGFVSYGLLKDDNFEELDFDGIKIIIDQEQPCVIVHIVEYIDPKDFVEINLFKHGNTSNNN